MAAEKIQRTLSDHSGLELVRKELNNFDAILNCVLSNECDFHKFIDSDAKLIDIGSFVSMKWPEEERNLAGISDIVDSTDQINFEDCEVEVFYVQIGTWKFISEEMTFMSKNILSIKENKVENLKK